MFSDDRDPSWCLDVRTSVWWIKGVTVLTSLLSTVISRDTRTGRFPGTTSGLSQPVCLCSPSFDGSRQLSWCWRRHKRPRGLNPDGTSLALDESVEEGVEAAVCENVPKIDGETPQMRGLKRNCHLWEGESPPLLQALRFQFPVSGPDQTLGLRRLRFQQTPAN